MNPTLREPTLMEVIPYQDRTIRFGDVILFHAPERITPIVHRVTKVTSEGIRTRGDNCSRVDEWLIQPEQVIGQVIASVRGSYYRPVAQGWRGYLRGKLLHAFLPIWKTITRLLHIPYHLLAHHSLPQCVIPARWRPYRAVFQVGEKQIFRILINGRVIGQYDGTRQQWQIDRPYRLLIDPRDLEMNRWI